MFMLCSSLFIVSLGFSEWTIQYIDPHSCVHTIIWGDTQFVAIAYSSSVLISPDGINWTKSDSCTSPYGATGAVDYIAWTGKEYVAVGTNGGERDSHDGLVSHSKDGITWHANVSNFSMDSAFYGIPNAIIWADTQLVLLNNYAARLAYGGPVNLSNDGWSWTICTYCPTSI
jgi:hypothetical protein